MLNWRKEQKFSESITSQCVRIISEVVKFGFSKKATKFEKIFVVLLTRASCSVHATAYLSKSWRRFFKTNVVKLYRQQNTLMNNYTAKMSLVPDDWDWIYYTNFIFPRLYYLWFNEMISKFSRLKIFKTKITRYRNCMIKIQSIFQKDFGPIMHIFFHLFTLKNTKVTELL